MAFDGRTIFPRRHRRAAHALTALSCLGASASSLGPRPHSNELPIAASRQLPVDHIPAEFGQLWNHVVVKQFSRGVQQEEVTPLTTVCQFGLGNSTYEVSRFVLGAIEPPVVLELLDVDPASGDDPVASQLAARLQSEFGERLRYSSRPTFISPRSSRGEPCDAVIFSEASSLFSVQRVVEHAGEHVLVAWVSHICVNEQGKQASPRCNFLNTMWEKTMLMRRGYCLSGVCMSRVSKNELIDPNALALECNAFAQDTGSESSCSEFGQDWYIWYNFLRRSESQRLEAGLASPSGAAAGIYVDVGASLPYDYSNTVVLDQCMGWRGICIEPNPYLVPFLRAYRGCEVYAHCADADTEKGRSFVDRDGTFAFAADCKPLGDILTQAGLRGKRIDVLSIDVEHGELRVLAGLPLDEFDIRLIVVEVSQGARWLEVDTALLPHGYAKIAVLGRDVVYAKLSELKQAGVARWPFLEQKKTALPPAWYDFHQRVVDDELEEEMRKERAAWYQGLRRH